MRAEENRLSRGLISLNSPVDTKLRFRLGLNYVVKKFYTVPKRNRCGCMWGGCAEVRRQPVCTDSVQQSLARPDVSQQLCGISESRPL